MSGKTVFHAGNFLCRLPLGAPHFAASWGGFLRILAGPQKHLLHLLEIAKSGSSRALSRSSLLYGIRTGILFPPKPSISMRREMVGRPLLMEVQIFKTSFAFLFVGFI